MLRVGVSRRVPSDCAGTTSSPGPGRYFQRTSRMQRRRPSKYAYFLAGQHSSTDCPAHQPFAAFCKYPVKLHLAVALPPPPPSRHLRTHRCSKPHSLEKNRLAATPSFLQIDDFTAHRLVHTEDLIYSAHAVLAIHSHHLHIVGCDDDPPALSSVPVVARLSSCCATSRFASAPPLPGKGLFIYLFYMYLYPPNPAPARTCVLNLAESVRISYPTSACTSYTPR